MKKGISPNVILVVFLFVLGCNEYQNQTSQEESIPIMVDDESFDNEDNESINIQEAIKFSPMNTFLNGYRNDLRDSFDGLKLLNMLQNDSVRSAYLYLEETKPSESDTYNLNAYKSNLANILIRQGKFEEVIELLSDVIASEKRLSVCNQRLLRSEALVQIGQIEEALVDLDYVIENGVRYKWKGYRQRGIIKFEILHDSIGGCEDLQIGGINSFTRSMYHKYCSNTN